MTNNDMIEKTSMVQGFEKVNPYISESGLKSGAAKANARIVPPEIPDFFICRTTGITPSEQTGNNIPISHAFTIELIEPLPNRFRVLSSPKSRLKIAATNKPVNRNGAACTVA